MSDVSCPKCGQRLYSRVHRDAHKQLYPDHFKSAVDDMVTANKNGMRPCGATEDPNKTAFTGTHIPDIPKHVNCNCVTEKEEAILIDLKPKRRRPKREDLELEK